VPLLLLALAVGGYLYMNQGKDFATSYKVKFIDGLFDAKKTQNSSFSKLFFSIRLTVENPSDFKGTLQGAKLTLSYKGKSLGDITLQKPVTIVPKGNTSVELPVAVPTPGVSEPTEHNLQREGHTGVCPGHAESEQRL
jgi:hypothetical protein